MIQYTANRLSRELSRPALGGLACLRRAGRFLRGNPRWVQECRLQNATDVVKAHGDSYVAGNLADRKSVSCSQIFVGRHCVHASVGGEAADCGLVHRGGRDDG